MIPPKITVYIVSHNYGKYLQESINSVLNQSMDEWELLLINDNSSDNTAEIINLYQGDQKIKAFHTKGIGLPAVANLAIQHAAGQYLIRLDADDIFDENILLVLGRFLDNHPEVALVFPDYYLIDETYGIISHEHISPLYDRNHVLDMPPNGACTMIRTDILKQVGGYREDLGAQDGLDMWTKIAKNHICRNINLPLFYYRRHGQNLTEKSQKIFRARRTIKKDAMMVDFPSYQPIISVIPCRKNYDFLPDLWSQKINNETLLDLSIQKNLQSDLFDKIVITSDSEDAKEIISKYKDKRLTFVPRDKKMTTPSSSIVHTLTNVLQSLSLGWEGITVLSYIQAPFVTVENLEEAITTLVLNNADSAFAVEEVNQPLYKRTAYGLAPINFFGKFRSDFDIVYSDARTSLAVKNINLKSGSLNGSKIVNFLASHEENFFIHSKKDLEIAKIFMQNSL